MTVVAATGLGGLVAAEKDEAAMAAKVRAVAEGVEVRDGGDVAAAAAAGEAAAEASAGAAAAARAAEAAARAAEAAVRAVAAAARVVAGTARAGAEDQGRGVDAERGAADAAVQVVVALGCTHRWRQDWCEAQPDCTLRLIARMPPIDWLDASLPLKRKLPRPHLAGAVKAAVAAPSALVPAWFVARARNEYRTAGKALR